MTIFDWWKRAVIYQIYPRSFKDTTGNGIGDLKGIISKLDYLKWLGVEAIWLSPCFRSPMEDFGYDITDYKDIDPLFGTLKDMDDLIAEAHSRNLKVILDYVANHTSDKHQWFQESKKSKSNSKSDYYIWKDAKPDGSVPNNWICVPGGSAWEWCEDRQQYYYHAFLKCQPDVNWKNPELQKEMLDVLHFWLKRGVDGFRIDMISWLYKDDEWRDNPVNPDYNPKVDMTFMKLIRKYTLDQPGLFKFLEKISEVVNSYDNKVIIGEVSFGSKLEDYPKYYGTDGNLIHIPAMFEFIKIHWERDTVLKVLQTYYSLLPSFAWPNFQLGNHDRSRVATRFGGRNIARAAAVLLLTLKGTPFIYNGEELGLEDVFIPDDKIQDPTSNLESKLARDAFRTPMQWDNTEYSGFSTVEPWLPVSDDFREYNVASESSDEKSFLELYKTLLELRNTQETLQTGEIELLTLKNQNCLAYNRNNHNKKEFGIFINFSKEEQEIEIKDNYTILLSSYLDRKKDQEEEKLLLRNAEAVMIQYKL